MGGVMGKAQVTINTGAIGTGDSIAAYLVDSAGTLLTSTLVGADQSLDTNVTQIVGTYAEDSAHSDTDLGYFMLGVRNDAGGSLVGTDLDYEGIQFNNIGELRTTASFTSNFTYAEDSPHTTGEIGAFMLAVRNDANAALTSADLDYSPVAVDSAGRIKTGDLYAEDSPHTSTDDGSFILAIRSDSFGALAGTDLDYSGLQTWSNGELKTVDIANNANLQQVVPVTTTATALPTSALANRKTLFLQNLDGNAVFIGSATVTATGITRGISLNKGAFVVTEAGPGNAVFGIVAAGTNDVAIWEHS